MSGAYSPTYYYRNKEEIKRKNKAQFEATRSRRKELLSTFPCVACGEIDTTVIQWHHVDPSEKDVDLFKSLSEEKFWNEVLKCVPLCANCHVKLHKNTLCLLKSPTAYKLQAATENIYVRDSTCPQ